MQNGYENSRFGCANVRVCLQQLYNSGSLQVGDVLDCLDRHERWHIAKVTEVCADGDTLSVSFKGWDRKHNESLPRSSPRIARPGSQTANGKESRVPRRQGDAFCIDLEELASLELRIDDFMAGGFSVDEQVCEC